MTTQPSDELLRKAADALDKHIARRPKKGQKVKVLKGIYTTTNYLRCVLEIDETKTPMWYNRARNLWQKPWT